MDDLDVITDDLISIWFILLYSNKCIKKEWSHKLFFDFPLLVFLSVIKKEQGLVWWLLNQKNVLSISSFGCNPCYDSYRKLNTSKEYTFNVKKSHPLQNRLWFPTADVLFSFWIHHIEPMSCHVSFLLLSLFIFLNRMNKSLYFFFYFFFLSIV